MDDATVYSSDPAGQARAWQDAGFVAAVVDLNGAFAGRPVNGTAVAGILGAVTVPVQLGGGIRDMAGIETWLGAGIRRVILGSVAVKNPPLVREACRAFPGRIVVGIDARDGKVAPRVGPRPHRSTPGPALSFEDAGVAAIVLPASAATAAERAQSGADRGPRGVGHDTGNRLGRRAGRRTDRLRRASAARVSKGLSDAPCTTGGSIPPMHWPCCRIELIADPHNLRT
jgi:hypothetical protein